MITSCLESEFDLQVDPAAIRTAVRRSFLRAMALEFRQGYTKEEFDLPAEVYAQPNANIGLPNLATEEFMTELKQRVWEVFEPELEGLLD